MRRDARWLIALLVAGGWWLVAGRSVEGAELKMAYVNLPKVFENYDKTKASEAVLEKQGKEKEGEFESRMNELKKMRQNLELLSADAREAKGREIEQKSDELQRFRTNTARDLRLERDKIAKEILKEIQDGVEVYASAGGYSFVFDSGGLLYGQPAYDITDDVIKKLNSKTAAPAPAR